MNSPIKQPEQQVPSSCAFRSVDDFDWDNGTLVGSGRMSVVMACKTVAGRVISDHESSVPPTLALKSISKTRILQTKGAFERLRLEKKVLLELQEDAHPGVVKLFGTLQSEEYVYFVLEYGQGGDLMQYVRQYGALPVEACRVLTAQLVLTLSYLQEKGIVHRDIKAENLCFRTPHHSLFLIDFEHAVYCRNEPDPASATLAEDNTDDEREDIHYTVQEVHSIRRKSEAFCGTPTTMSPEMLCSCSWSYASDLWALGCVLYLMLTGKEPFGRNNMNLIDTFRCIVHEQEAHLERQLKADSPPEVDSSARDLVLGLLRKDPSQRFGTPQRGGMAALRAHSFFSDINWDESDVFRSHPFLEEHPPQLSTAYARALHEDGDGILTEEYLNQIFTNS